MRTEDLPCAASGLLDGLLGGRSGAPPGGVRPGPAPRTLTEVARTRVSVHYETGDEQVPVLVVCTPSAVRLPPSLVTSVLPPRGAASIDGAALRVGGGSWVARRWWAPPRPRGLPVPAPSALAAVLRSLAGRTVGLSPDELPGPAYDGLLPGRLVGRGPGLTPAGDDVLAGALVAAHAVADPRLPGWRTRTLTGLADTTAVSRALLRHAADGYAAPELADLVTALCRGGTVARALARLLAVGHTSGAALAHGVLHTLTTHHLEGAA